MSAGAPTDTSKITYISHHVRWRSSQPNNKLVAALVSHISHLAQLSKALFRDSSSSGNLTAGPLLDSQPCPVELAWWCLPDYPELSLHCVWSFDGWYSIWVYILLVLASEPTQQPVQFSCLSSTDRSDRRTCSSMSFRVISSWSSTCNNIWLACF